MPVWLILTNEAWWAPFQCLTQLVGAVGAMPPLEIAVTISAYVYATLTGAPAVIVPGNPFWIDWGFAVRP